MASKTLTGCHSRGRSSDPVRVAAISVGSHGMRGFERGLSAMDSEVAACLMGYSPSACGTRTTCDPFRERFVVVEEQPRGKSLVLPGCLSVRYPMRLGALCTSRRAGCIVVEQMRSRWVGRQSVPASRKRLLSIHVVRTYRIRGKHVGSSDRTDTGRVLGATVSSRIPDDPQNSHDTRYLD
jgi:hypothetical protein